MVASEHSRGLDRKKHAGSLTLPTWTGSTRRKAEFEFKLDFLTAKGACSARGITREMAWVNRIAAKLGPLPRVGGGEGALAVLQRTSNRARFRAQAGLPRGLELNAPG